MHYTLDFVNKLMREETEKAVSVDYLSTKKLGYTKYSNARYVLFPRILNGVVYDETGIRILASETLSPNVQNYHPSIVNQDVDYQRYEGTAILLGNIPYAFGHSFTDGFKSLWFALTEDYRNLLRQGAKPVLLVPSSQCNSLPSYWKTFLRALNINLEEVDIIAQNTLFDNIVIPDLCWGYDENGRIFFTEEYRQVCRKIANAVDLANDNSIGTFDKVYLTRTRFSNWQREFGESKLEKVFSKQGYKIVSPETLSIEKQIQILRGAKVVASTEGSISHAFIFCRPNTKVVIIRKTNWVNPYQLAINQAADLDVTFVDAHRTKVVQDEWKRMSGPFYLCITPEVEKFFGKRIPHCPLYLSLSYLWYRFRLSSWAQRKIMNRKIWHKIERKFC